MLQIDQHNLLVQKTLREILFPNEKESFKIIDRKFTDFDFTIYHVSTNSNNKEIVLFSIYLKCWTDLVKYNVIKYLNEKYSKYNEFITISSPNKVEENYNYSLILDTKKIQQKNTTEIDEMIKELSLLKRHSMSAPFNESFLRYDQLSEMYLNKNTYSDEIQKKLQDENIITIKYRGSDESIHIKPSYDRVTIVFSTMFQDETDKIFGKVFLQEFVDARKRSVQTAPQVLYSNNECPLDFKKVDESKNKENKGYIIFIMFPRHLIKGEMRENCISHIQFFRNYFHYHIKCSKAYMHSRMRFRVKEFSKILNRAVHENESDDKKQNELRKTASGRKFEIKT